MVLVTNKNVVHCRCSVLQMDCTTVEHWKRFSASWFFGFARFCHLDYRDIKQRSHRRGRGGSTGLPGQNPSYAPETPKIIVVLRLNFWAFEYCYIIAIFCLSFSSNLSVVGYNYPSEYVSIQWGDRQIAYSWTSPQWPPCRQRKVAVVERWWPLRR